MFSRGVLKAFSSMRGGTDAEGACTSGAGDEVTFAAADPVRLAAEGTALGQGIFNSAGDMASPRTGTILGTEMIGLVPGCDPVTSPDAAIFGNGATTVFGNSPPLTLG